VQVFVLDGRHSQGRTALLAALDEREAP